jgi:hypothetical protein
MQIPSIKGVRMKRPIFLLILLLFAVSAYGKEFTQAYEDKLIQDLKGIYTQEAVKTPDNPTGHPVDATPIILQARHDFPFLSSEAKKALYPLFTRPSFAPDSEYTFNSPGGYFKVHFAKTGTNAVYQPNADINGNGVPDYVDTCAAVLDHVWSKEIDTLGYSPPPSDGWYSLYGLDNGGDGRYDIYLLNLGSTYLGATYPETTNTTPPIVWTSFITLDNNYTDYPPDVLALHSQYDWLRVTAAHEFFHAVQFGYDASEFELGAGEMVKPYWMEMSATWMEDQVYDYINDYINYLTAFFNFPWLSLRTFRSTADLHAYGAVVWPIYLGEKYGIDIIKAIWTKCAEVPGDNVLPATDAILGTHNSSLNNAFQEFSVWNYFTADRANPSLFGFYSEGDSFWTKNPSTPIKVHETNMHNGYPVSDTVNQLPEDLGATYITFTPVAGSIGGLRIYFEGNTGARWNASLIDYMSNDHPFEDTTIDLNPDSGMGLVFDWARFSEISMVIARGDTISIQNYNYRYTAIFDTSLFHGFIPPSADKIYQNFPNPFVITDASSTTKFPMLLKYLTDVELFIFTTSGELVWKHLWQNKIGDYTTAVFADPEFIPFKWNGRNMSGEYVASGIYLYRIVTNGTSVTKKLVVVNER